MNLNEALDVNAIQQDEWSLTAPKFGKEQQLTVVGWSGRTRTNKLYIVRCSFCSKDSELFGEGYFFTKKENLLMGKVPCGCGVFPKWSNEQYQVLCSRKAQELGYTFLGFEGEYCGSKTKIKMLCQKHGEWSSGIVHSLLNIGCGCPRCAGDASSLSNIKPDDVMIKSFFDSGGFHPDTKFWRSERVRSDGAKAHWFILCPECKEFGESTSGSLQSGARPCLCSQNRQKEAYINWLVDPYTSVIVAVKFGISRDSKQRTRKQNYRSNYEIKQHLVYTFPNVYSCKKSERECLQELECGVVLKRDMRDGYTETTWPSNLEKIIEIYQRNGGILNDRQ